MKYCLLPSLEVPKTWTVCPHISLHIAFLLLLFPVRSWPPHLLLTHYIYKIYLFSHQRDVGPWQPIISLLPAFALRAAIPREQQDVTAMWVAGELNQWSNGFWWPGLCALPEIYSKFWVCSLLSLDSTTGCALILFIIRFPNFNNVFSTAHVPLGRRDSIINIIVLLKETHTTLLPKGQLNEFEFPVKPRILTYKDKLPAMKAPLPLIIYRGQVHKRIFESGLMHILHLMCCLLREEKK